MEQVIEPAGTLSGSIRVPPDKSLTHRSIFFSSLANGTSTIENPLLAEDCLSTARCMEQLGVKIERGEKKWTVHGKGLWSLKPSKKILDCGNSGTTTRLLSGILSAQDFSSELTGDASLQKRPMNRVAAPLTEMGARFDLKDGKFPPFKIHGTKQLKPISWKNPVASAQVKSAVLLAALHTKGETIYQEPTVSRDHTERMLEACGVPIKRHGAVVRVQGPSELKPQHWVIPGDISSAAFFLVAGLLVSGSDIVLESININPTRTGILDVLLQTGAGFGLTNKKTLGGEPVADFVVNKQGTLKAFSIDEDISPRLIDEIPILAVAATQAHGISVFSGIGELRVKETDRLKAIAANLRLMGAKVEEKPDGLVIEGPVQLEGARINSYDDHRIAMAFAVAGLIARGQTTIDPSECVSISFPTFWTLLNQLCRA